MKYYLIAGEASGDIHASHLMTAIKQEDAGAEFRCIGGDMMAAAGATLLMHYRDLAYMGIVPVLRHLPTILRGLRNCKKDILSWQPDVLILVDYPGFNLKIARFAKQHTDIPVCYYIAPKIWAWKEHRIKDIKRDVDCLLSILPFEVKFYEEKHRYPVHYVGNPTLDEVTAYLEEHPADGDAFRRDNGLDARPIIALLPGSRRQEVRDNLRRMVQAAMPFATDYQFVLAAAPGLDDDYYQEYIQTINGTWLNVKCSVRSCSARSATGRLLLHESGLARLPATTAGAEGALRLARQPHSRRRGRSRTRGSTDDTGQRWPSPRYHPARRSRKRSTAARLSPCGRPPGQAWCPKESSKRNKEVSG